MKTKEEILDDNLELCFLVHNKTMPIEYKPYLLLAMKEYAAQFQYNYSHSCKCESRTGETWCCNQCGLPVRNSKEV